jgi:hypothetical protein
MQVVMGRRWHHCQLADRLGVRPAAVTLDSSLRRVWPDGTLGCPHPGPLYPQTQVPGSRLSLRAGERLLLLHADRRGSLVGCPAELAQPPLPARAAV